MDMPTYEYVCRSCGTHVEVYQHFDDPPLTECGVCGGPLRKVFHPAGILFKGSGFYATDSRRRSASSSGESGKGDEGTATSEPAAKTSEAKEPAKKPDGKEPKDGAGSKEKSA
jgi:putative FmdB family regulatory protein